MPADPVQHHRSSMRLTGYDYSQAGAYFVTLVTQGRICLFGEVINGEMRLNRAGEMIERWWGELENKFPSVRLGTFVIMPNHFHGIIQIVGVDLRVDPLPGGRTQGGHTTGGHTGPPLQDGAREDTVGVDLRVDPLPGEHTMGGHTGPPLPEIMQWFKTMTTNEYIRGVKQHGWARFSGKLWQRSYYDHIVRHEAELNLIHLYIASNPANWLEDSDNPSQTPQA